MKDVDEAEHIRRFYLRLEMGEKARNYVERMKHMKVFYKHDLFAVAILIGYKYGIRGT